MRLRARLREAGIAFFFGCGSWFLLTFVWFYASPDGWMASAIGTLMSPPYRLGRHLAHEVFRSYESWSAAGYYAAPSMGIAGEVLLLAGLWYVALELGHLIRTGRHSF